MVLVIHRIHFRGQSSEAIVSSAQRKTGVRPDCLGSTLVWSVVLLHEVWSAIMLLVCLYPVPLYFWEPLEASVRVASC